MNLIESWFWIQTRRQVRRRTYADVGHLIEAIEGFIAGDKANPRPFV